MDFQVEPRFVLLKTPNTPSVVLAAIAYIVSGLEGASARLVRAISDGAGNPLVSCCQVLPLSSERQMPFFAPVSSMVGCKTLRENSCSHECHGQVTTGRNRVARVPHRSRRPRLVLGCDARHRGTDLRFDPRRGGNRARPA